MLAASAAGPTTPTPSGPSGRKGLARPAAGCGLDLAGIHQPAAAAITRRRACRSQLKHIGIRPGCWQYGRSAKGGQRTLRLMAVPAGPWAARARPGQKSAGPAGLPPGLWGCPQLRHTCSLQRASALLRPGGASAGPGPNPFFFFLGAGGGERGSSGVSSRPIKAERLLLFDRRSRTQRFALAIQATLHAMWRDAGLIV